MPLEDLIIGLPRLKVQRIESGTGKKVEFFVTYEGEVKCPHCQGEVLRKKDRFWRRVRHLFLGDRFSELILLGFKFQCLGCRRYFHQRFPGILPRKRSSETFRKQVALEHHDGITQKTLALRMALGQATIERWYQDYLHLQVQEQKGAHCPRILGIDEHFFTRKKGYATTFCDLTKHCVYDVQLGRSQKALEGYLKCLQGKERVQVLLMDLADSYRALARKFFPRAKIVADRFHVIRLVNHHFLQVWKELDPVGRKHRGLLCLIRQHGWNLKLKSQKNIQRYLQEVPAFQAVYDFKQRLCRLLLKKTQTARQCRHLIPQFLRLIEALRTSGFETMKTLGLTLERWKEEIVRMWRFSKTNSITEGFHNKMEMISRRAYGFRNFENYRLRVKAHCGYNAWKGLCPG